jgi:iron(III) transport system substrate-binding protein
MKSILFGALALMLYSGTARAQLAFDGEQIADTKLLAAAKSEGQLNMFGTRPSESIGPVLEQFKKDTGLSLEYTRFPSNKVFERVNAEFAAGKLEADYIDLTDLTLLGEWVKMGVLAKYKVPSHDRIDASIKHPDGMWYYIARPSMMMAINTAEISEADAPKSWKESLDPKWKGKIGMQSIEVGGSAFSAQAFLRIKVGADSWTRLAAEEPRLYPSVAALTTDLVRGRVGLAYIDASSVATQIQAGAPLKIILPSEGLVGFGVFGGISVKAPHPNAAKLWMNYVTSKRGSTLMSQSGAYGTHPDAPPPVAAGVTLPKPDKVWTISLDEWEKVSAPWTEEWQKIVAVKR